MQKRFLMKKWKATLPNGLPWTNKSFICDCIMFRTIPLAMIYIREHIQSIQFLYLTAQKPIGPLNHMDKDSVCVCVVSERLKIIFLAFSAQFFVFAPEWYRVTVGLLLRLTVLNFNHHELGCPSNVIPSYPWDRAKDQNCEINTSSVTAT